MGKIFRVCQRPCRTTIPVQYAGHAKQNMLAGWAIALQWYVVLFYGNNKPGNLHVIPDTMLPQFVFEHQQQQSQQILAHLCRNTRRPRAANCSTPHNHWYSPREKPSRYWEICTIIRNIYSWNLNLSVEIWTNVRKASDKRQNLTALPRV